MPVLQKGENKEPVILSHFFLKSSSKLSFNSMIGDYSPLCSYVTVHTYFSAIPLILSFSLMYFSINSVLSVTTLPHKHFRPPLKKLHLSSHEPLGVHQNTSHNNLFFVNIYPCSTLWQLLPN